MAGLGRKTWSAGEVVTAANVQGYLQDQSVMKFADSTARSSALGTAVSAGMVSYNAASTAIELYDGSTWKDIAAHAAAQNAIINGAFDIWQRGTSFSNPTGGAADYTADRWTVEHDGTGATRTVSQQTFTPGSAPVAGYEGTYFLRYAVTGGTGNTYQQIEQRVEDVRTFAGQTVTLSFWAKADAVRTIEVLNRRVFGTGGSTGDQSSLGTVTISTSWARYSITGTMGSMSGKTIGASSYSQWNLRFAAATAQTIDIWGVQLEAGSVATPFKRNAPSIQAELAACQRYYYRIDSADFFSRFGIGVANSSTVCEIQVPLKVSMRTTPTSLDYSTIRLISGTAGFAASSVAIGTGQLNKDIALVLVTVASGLTTNNVYSAGPNGGIGYLGFSAEL